MHGVRQTLLEQQAQSLGLGLEKVLLTKDQTEAEYESKMREVLTKYLADGVIGVAFGDIFLADIRKRRQDNLSKIGMKGLFPLWKSDTAELAEKFVDLGFKAIITCVDSKMLDKKWIGRDIDKQFLAELDANVDPCGENGEFHSFVYDGPIFKKKIAFVKGDVVFREDRFYYCDLIPQGGGDDRNFNG